MYDILDSGVRRNDVSTDPSTVMPAKAGIQSLAHDVANPSENGFRCSPMETQESADASDAA